MEETLGMTGLERYKGNQHVLTFCLCLEHEALLLDIRTSLK